MTVDPADQTHRSETQGLDHPRVPLLDADGFDDQQRELTTERQRQVSLFQLVAQHPEALRRLKATGSFANRETQIPARDRELMILRMSWLYNSEFEWGQHYQQARDTGLTSEAIERIKVGPSAGGWSEWDLALLVATDGLVSDAMIPTSAWDVLAAQWPTEVMLELVIFFGHYTMVAMFANTFGLGVAPGRAGFSGQAKSDPESTDQKESAPD